MAHLIMNNPSKKQSSHVFNKNNGNAFVEHAEDIAALSLLQKWEYTRLNKHSNIMKSYPKITTTTNKKRKHKSRKLTKKEEI